MKKTFKLAVLLFPVALGQTASGQMVINELLADPAGDITGDANGDGTRNGSEDEFIEFINTSGGQLNIGGWVIQDAANISRHVFADPTLVESGQAVVVFGGGTPTGTFGGAIVRTASSGLVGLNNGTETITLYDGDPGGAGVAVVSYSYGSEGGSDQSITRDPDISGTDPLVIHSAATGSGGALFSPGTQVDGSPFGGEIAAVSLVLDTVSEADANPATTGTVTLSIPAVGNVLVTLDSSDETEATVPATVTVLSGQTTANFDVTVVDDAEADGDQTTSISASATGFFTGSVVLTVTDDEAPLPVVTLSADPATISENGGTSTITIEVDVADPAGYSFTLSSSNTDKLTVPASVAIAANQTSATFTASGVDNATSEGTQSVTITAEDDAEVSLDATVDVTVTDDEFVPPSLVINEIRIDDPGTDDDEYVELYSETANASLDSLTLVVIGDGSVGSGAVERAISLDGFTTNGNYFVIGALATMGTADLTTGTNVFENGDNLTFLLVTDFTGSEGDDLDTNDDGTLDSLPWTSIIDGVATYEGIDPPENGVEFEYSTQLSLPRVGPDGPFPPGHIFRSPNGSGDWQIGMFDPLDENASDTPGAENSGDGNPPAGDLVVTAFSMDRSNGAGSLTATGLGAQILVVESSTDLGQSDAWAPLAFPASEVDNPDGSVTFNFTDSEAVGAGKLFYRLNEAP